MCACRVILEIDKGYDVTKTAKSNKHHYIPKYYLRGFCDDQGKLFVYNKKWNHLDKSGKTPTQIFYEDELHTLCINGRKDVFIEDVYNKIESQCSDFLRMISNLTSVSIADVRSNEDCCNIIKLMISLQFWRLPSSKDMANTTSEDLLVIFDNFRHQSNKLPQLDKKTIKRLYKNRDKENVKKIIQFLALPLTTCNFDGKLPDDFKIIKTDGYEHDLLCSDRPMFYEEYKDFMFSGEFFFPLSKKILLMRTNDSAPIDLDVIQEMTVRNANDKYFGSSTALVERFRPVLKHNP